MPAARDTAAYPVRSATQDELRVTGIQPIATGGLPSATGAIGVPSGVFVPQRLANGITSVTRLSAGRYQIVFAPAPNGTVRAWVDLQAATVPTVVDILPDTKDVQTGYVNIQCYSATGVKIDPAVGDVIAFELTLFTTGNAAGP